MHSGHKGPNIEDWITTAFVFPYYTVEIPPFWTAESLHHCTSRVWLSQYTFSVSLWSQDELNPISSAGLGLLPQWSHLGSCVYLEESNISQWNSWKNLSEILLCVLACERSKHMTALRTLLGTEQIKIQLYIECGSPKDCLLRFSSL